MNRAKKSFLRLKHYIFSNTLHGTHSPFVYDFLENTVYQTNSKVKNKYDQLISRIIASREPSKVILFENSIIEEELIQKYNQLKSNTDEKSIFVFTDIRKSEIRFKAWETIIADETNKISIDLFEIGILFFEQKKPKEHFTIYY